MRQFLAGISILLVCSTLSAQRSPGISIAENGCFTIDNQNNLYVWGDAVLYKYETEENGEFRLCAQYSDRSLGGIASVDASIPTKLLVFHKDAGALVLLDHKLTPIYTPIQLFDKGFNSISLAAVSGANHIALYDDSNRTLYQVDYELNKLSATPCSGIAPSFHPTSIQTHPNKKLALTDAESGIYLFDAFGTYEKRIPVAGIEAVQLQGEKIYYLKEGIIYVCSSNQTPEPWFDSNGEITDFRKALQNLYWHTADRKLQITPISQK